MDLSQRQPVYRSAILASILLVCSIALYGYGRMIFDDFSYASLPATYRTYPENFKNDPIFDYNIDRYPAYTLLLEQIYKTQHEEFWLFIFFLISKFIIFLGIIRVANLIIHEKFLILVSGIFLLSGVELGLQYGWIGVSATMAVPRLIGWGFFLLGFECIMMSKKMLAAIFFGISSLIHIHFVFFAFPILILNEVISIYHKKTFSYKNFIHFFLYLLLSAPNIIHAFSISNVLFANKELVKEIYVDTLSYFHFQPQFFLVSRGLLFLILLIPFFYYKKIPLDNQKKKLWYSTVFFIIFGTIISIFLTIPYFNPLAIYLWYGGFTSFISLTSYIFFIFLATSKWESVTKTKKIIILSWIYISALIPFLGALLYMLALLAKTVRKKFSYAKFAWQITILTILLLASPLLTDYFNQFKVYDLFNKKNLSIPMELYQFIKKNTSRDAIFLTPPVGFDALRNVAKRSMVVDAKTHHSGKYLKIWKSRMLDIAHDTKSKNLTRQGVTSNTYFFRKSPDEIFSLAQKYYADYFITGIEYKKKFDSSRHFTFIYDDKNYIMYKINPVKNSF